MGRDVSNEIMFEGTPDGSRFLGLDRRAFLSTACVRQADLMSVREDARKLQTHLQRAAAAHGTDATAASALDALSAFKREHVGQARANSTKPLQKGIERERGARTALDNARRQAEALVEREQALREAAKRAEDARVEVAALQNMMEFTKLQALRSDLSEAEELTETASGDMPSVPDNAEIQEVRDTIASWSATPATAMAAGRTVSDLQADLAALPEANTTDTEPRSALVRAAELLKDCERRVELMDEARPAEPARSSSKAGAEEIRSLASALNESAPPQAPPEHMIGQSELARLRSRQTLLLATAVVLAAIGIGLVLVEPVGAIVAFVGAVGAGVLAVAHSQLRKAEHADRRGNASTDPQRAWQDRRDSVLARLNELELPGDSEELTKLANVEAAHEGERNRFETWSDRRATLTEATEHAALVLATALSEAGVEQSGSPLPLYERYVEACSVARRRQLLEDQIASRETIEAAGAAQYKAASLLREIAGQHAIKADRHPDLVVIDLRAWVLRAEEAGERARAVEQSRGQLERVLRGRTIDELRAQMEDLQRSIGDSPVSSPPMAPDRVEIDLAQARGKVRLAEGMADTLKGQVGEFTATVDSVAEAEEELRAAEAELARVEALGETLDAARSFLEQAQDKVHRDIAPVLKATIDAYIGRITGGHYVNSAVDPSTLLVRVVEASGQYRDATLLSHGTAEQIYLLLRVALAEHLTTPGESCPLILDDVTVQSDETRTRAILEVLRDLAEDRQIILFTQEDDVRDWGEDQLKGTNHRIQYLTL